MSVVLLLLINLTRLKHFFECTFLFVLRSADCLTGTSVTGRFRCAALAVLALILPACASNNALTLMEASKQQEPLIPDAEVVKQELKGRKLVLRYVYYDTDRGIHVPEELPQESYLILLQEQIQRGFSAASVDQGRLPAYVIDIAIEDLWYSRVKGMFQWPADLRVRMEIRRPDETRLMSGELLTRYEEPRKIIAPVIVLPTLPIFEGQYWMINKMIPATAIAVTRVSEGLKDGKGLAEIKVYPATQAPAGSIDPEAFLYGKPYGLSKLSEDYIQEAITEGEAVSSLVKESVLAYKQGDYKKSLEIDLKALNVVKAQFGSEHPRVSTRLTSIGETYRKLGQYVEARASYEEAIAIREQIFGSQHHRVAYVLNEMGLLYKDEGRTNEAEAMYQQALTINENALGPNHPMVAFSLFSLASLYNAEGRYTEAEKLLKRSLAINEEAFGPEDARVATVQYKLADLYMNTSQYSVAEPLYLQALAVREKIYGPDNNAVTRILSNLASLYYQQGRYAEAEPMWQRALTITADTPGHPDEVAILENMAALYRKMGKPNKAREMTDRAVWIRAMSQE